LASQPRRVRCSGGGFPANVAEILQKPQTYYEQYSQFCPFQSVDPKVTTSANKHAVESSPLDTPPGLGLGSDPQIEPDGSYYAAGDFVQFDEFFPLSDSPSFAQRCESVPTSSIPTISEPSISSLNNPSSWDFQLPPTRVQTSMCYPTSSNGSSSSTEQASSLLSQSYCTPTMREPQTFSPIQTTATRWAFEPEPLPSAYPSEGLATRSWEQSPPHTQVQPASNIPMSSYYPPLHALSSSAADFPETTCQECHRSFDFPRDLR